MFHALFTVCDLIYSLSLFYLHFVAFCLYGHISFSTSANDEIFSVSTHMLFFFAQIENARKTDGWKCTYSYAFRF